MTYKLADTRIGLQSLTETSTTALHELGAIVKGVDNGGLGQGEFIYLLGVASTVAGSVVTFDPSTYLTTLAAVGGNQPQPVAIAMSANVASQYGWYQISGVATAAKTCTVSLAAGAAVGVLTTGLMAGTGSGKEIQGAVCAAVASAKASVVTVKVMLQRPHMQGRVT
jgi:hypothetical protein